MKQSPACKTGMRGHALEATLLASSDTTGLCATLAHASEKWSRAKNIPVLLQQGVRRSRRSALWVSLPPPSAAEMTAATLDRST